MAQATVGELTLDLSIYPRQSLNYLHVDALAEALRAGAHFPPIVVEHSKGYPRIVDGAHRHGSAKKVYGVDHLLEVEEREYASEGEVFLDCIRLNAHHGCPLSNGDRARIVSMGADLQIAENVLAAAMQITGDRAARLMERKVATAPDGSVAILKPIASHLAQVQLTDAQHRAIRRDIGRTPCVYANMLLNALRSDLLDWSHRATVERLTELYQVLGDALEARTKPPAAS